MIRLLTLYAIVLCFLNIDLTRVASSNAQQTCNVSCSLYDGSCTSKINYYYCLKMDERDNDCTQELNETEEFICEHCDWSNSVGLTPEELEKVLKCSGPLTDQNLSQSTPSENCGYILDYLECRSQEEEHVKCKNNQGVGSPPSYKELYRMASSLCSGANGSLYATCDRFLEEYKQIFDFGGDELLIRISDTSWWCGSFRKVLVAAGIEVHGTNCDILDYDSLRRKLSLKYQANWTEYCQISQDSTSSSTPSSTTSPAHTSLTYRSSTSRPSTTLPSTVSETKPSTISSLVDTNTPLMITKRNGGEQSSSSGYFCLLAYGLATVIAY